MKLKMKLKVALFALICTGLFSGLVQARTVLSGASTGATAEGVSYLNGSFKDWENNTTLVTSVGVYKIDLSVWLLDKLGTRAGRRDTPDGSPINVQLKFLNGKLQQVVIY
ncbi:MAG: hypothetical protein OQL27_05075 [Sedimenticola sp.]|nr:hypothetical protein [Sedimenticola sp.]